MKRIFVMVSLLVLILSGCTTLHESVMKGDVESIKNYSAQEINSLDENGRTALSKAIAQNNYEMVRALVEKGADVSMADKYGYKPIFYAIDASSSVALGDTKIIQYLLENKSIVNDVDNNGNTGLIYSLLNTNPQSAKIFLNNGADVNIKNNNGIAPLNVLITTNKSSISKNIAASVEEINNLKPIIQQLGAKEGKTYVINGIYKVRIVNGNILATKSEYISLDKALYLEVAKKIITETSDKNSYRDKNGKTYKELMRSNDFLKESIEYFE